MRILIPSSTFPSIKHKNTKIYKIVLPEHSWKERRSDEDYVVGVIAKSRKPCSLAEKIVEDADKFVYCSTNGRLVPPKHQSKTWLGQNSVQLDEQHLEELSAARFRYLGRFPFSQNFRNFQSEIQWNGKSSGKNFRKFRTTFWAYPSFRNFRNYRIFCVPFAMSVGFSLPGRARTSRKPKEPQTKWLRKCIYVPLVGFFVWDFQRFLKPRMSLTYDQQR